jgi:2-oxoglutarate ferredoxin oxidoreductase subunit gamma
LRLSGFGGQGIILAAYVIGKAAAVIEGRHATLNQSFGPEARGSACSAQVVLSDECVSYPYVRAPEILVAMSQDAYRIFVDEVVEGGLVLIDDSLVTPKSSPKHKTLGVPATRLAEGLGRRIMANMVMVGFFTAVTGIVSPEAAAESVRSSVPSGSQDVNLEAFEQGLAHGYACIGKPDPRAGREEVTT